MCLTKEEITLLVIGIASLGAVLGYLWDSMFQHPEDN